MYICDKCGKTVEELPTYTERTGTYGEEPYIETFGDAECACGGEYVEAGICKRCGEYFPEDEGEHGFCPKCQAELIKRFDARTSVFSPEEKEFLWEAWEI